MKIVVIGTGGVGGYFGGRLALSGNNVSFIARGEHLKAIQAKGLKIKSAFGDFSIYPAQVSSSYNAIKNADLVMVASKAGQVKEIAEIIAPLIGDGTMVMPMQNGVLAAKELADFISSKQIIGGLCRVFSKIESPGVISHMGSDPTIIFGELNHEKTERSAWLKYTFDSAGITNIWSENIEVELWKKFLMISSSALLAVSKTNYGELRSLPETRQLLEELYTEIYEVGRAEGVDLPENIVEKTMKAVDNFPADSTSSLTRDIWEGKPSEIEYQNGTVVKLGEKYGVPTPINRFVFNTILPMEKKARNIVF
ncbi:MAG: 2-dehydropantoate 2-reductase [Prolixibacteraceae bacterium]|jgi:2-dehydropantoate 2-reductase|nr:2-dehydropantoate 2-reductase [Prolixibacteraceae bacterium]